MLPTRPRALTRSMCSSCTTPCSSMATRVSCGVTLMRISCISQAILQYGADNPRERRGGFRKRQSHHAGIAPLDVRDECRGKPLDRIPARFVEGFTTRDVVPDLARGQATPRDMCRGEGHLDLVLP